MIFERFVIDVCVRVRFGIDVGWIFASFLEVFLFTFPGFAKNAAPHELTVNTIQIEGRALVKASKKASRNEEQKRDENEDEQIMDFGDILGSFREAFGSILGSKSRSKFGVFFWTVFFAIRFPDATRL